MDSLGGSRSIEFAFLITVVVFYVFTIANVLAYVLGPGPVTGDKIHDAIAAYILTGLMWASIYLVLDRLVPGSFFVSGVSDRTTPLTWEHLVSFSFATLTSTGYGWIVPASASCAIVGHSRTAGGRVLCGDPDCPPRRSVLSPA